MTLDLKYPQFKKRVIFGTSSKKDVASSLYEMTKYASKIHLIQANHNRAMEIGALEQAAKSLFENHFVTESEVFEPTVKNGDIESTIKLVLETKSNPDEILVIVGSFFIMREAKNSFGIEVLSDPFELNEIN